MALKQEIYSINYLKGVCSILVVLIHTHLLGKIIFIPFYRCAVPLFFMISGYFLMGREGWYRDRIFHILKKMVIIWGITNIVYYSFIQFIFTEYDSIHNLQTFIQTLGIEFIFGGEFCGPLWYITAYIWALIIIYIFNIKRNRNTFLLVAFLLLVNVLL